MPNDYGFHLAKWGERDKGLYCPGCGKARGAYKEYIVDETGEPVDPLNHLCGKCDHENNCGYHLPPKEFYRLNPDQRKEKADKKPEPKQRYFIEHTRQDVARTMQKYEINTFVSWLYSLPWDEEVRQALPLVVFSYALGTTKDGSVIFWQVDEDGNVRAGKKMLYDKTGHRMKDSEGNAVGTGWVHAIMRRAMANPYCNQRCKECQQRAKCPYPADVYDLNQCLFGLHLLKGLDPNKVSIHIVESEKTAVLMACFDKKACDTQLWLATGGKHNLSPAKLEPLKQFKVVCYPDVGAEDQWREKVKDMQNVTISTTWQRMLTDQDPKGADIADVCLRRMMMTPEAKLLSMTETYPMLKQLIETLKLELKK